MNETALTLLKLKPCLKVTPSIRDIEFPLKNLDVNIINIAKVDVDKKGNVSILMKGGHRHWIKEDLDQLLEQLCVT